MVSTKLEFLQTSRLILVQDCLAQVESRLKLIRNCLNKINWSFAYSLPTSKAKPFISKKLLG